MMKVITIKNLITSIVAYTILSCVAYATNKANYVPHEIIIKFTPDSLTTINKSLSKNSSYIQNTQPFFSPDKIRKMEHDKYGFNRIFKITLSPTSNIEQVLADLSKNSSVEYCQLNHVFHLDYVPNDPYIGQQWHLEKIGVSQAWDLTRGSKSILVAIIDTGIDYNHEDLHANLWLNTGEDLDGNGKIDSTDFNGIDDDNNGFVDDIRGWDFTDAPYFPDGGDYLTRDNDPMDEHGHGTAIAGIIGATADNEIGIAGIAHGCCMMNLRAGTSQGLLEEEDVASAIIYAVDNGARVINLSFGDVVASPLLHDVMQFAFYHNCVLIASAGNSSNAEIHYPSGFNETISVGATTREDVLASFSSYGTTIDLVAPGESILSTKPGNQYGSFNGTSASAPVVSAVAALILSHQPQLTNEMVKNILLSSADDLGVTGRDDIHGTGRVNAYRALQVKFASEAEIFSPILDMGFHESPIIISGTAAGALLDYYTLYYGVGEHPDEWQLVEHISSRQVIHDTLGLWDCASLPDTSYTIRLQVINHDGSSVEDLTRIFIDRTSPLISDIKTTTMLDGRYPSVLIEFQTDDFCRGSIFYRAVNSTQPFNEIRLDYIAKSHRYNFTDIGNWEFYVSVTNNSGLQQQTEILTDHFINLLTPEIAVDEFVEAKFQLPPGYMFEKMTDLDEDGFREVILNEFGDNGSYDRLKIYEYEAGFHEVFSSDFLVIPRDIGDSDQDGRGEILAGSGPISFILESPAKGDFPSIIAWADSNDFWASRFSDLDDDGIFEIIGRQGDTFSLCEAVGDNQYSPIATLINPTPGSNTTGVPHTEIGDFDGDGHHEILIGDYDGDVYIYEAVGNNQFQPTWWERQPLIDCIDFIASGDYDGDGVTDFAVGCHSSPDLDAEHEYDARHWIFRIYKTTGDNSYAPVWEQAFFGYETIKNSSNGISSGDVDQDNIDELLINIFPDFYIIDYDSINHQFYPQWYFYPNESQGNIVGDIDGDLVTEFFLNNGKQLISFNKNQVSHPVLAPPYGFKAWSLDTNQVQLMWTPNEAADKYFIYRGETICHLILYSSTGQTEFVDQNVVKDSTYWYAIAATNNDDTSRLTNPLAVIPGKRPYLLQANYIYPDQVRLTFSEPMNSSIKNSTRYYLNNQANPRSVIITKSSQEVLLTFNSGILNEGINQISVSDVYDQHGTPIDTLKNIISFQVVKDTPAPYLVTAELTSSDEITLYFNEPLDPISAKTVANYRIEPSVDILSIKLPGNDGSNVILNLDKSTPIGAFGKNYIIIVQNIKNVAGVSIKDGQGDQIALAFYKENLSNVFVYPNPFRPGEDGDYITFANLTKLATIKILTTSGEVVREIKEDDGNGGAEWDLRDNAGNFVSSGIYLFYIKNGNETKIGKFAVLR